MYEKQEHYLPITIWYLQHVGNHAIMPKKQMTWKQTSIL